MNLRQYILNNLKAINIKNENLTAETNFILEYKFGITNPYSDVNITNLNYSELDYIFDERKTGKPLQYILHSSEFMGKCFYVDENVLIPRPETEILVQKVIDTAKTIHAPQILDIGTGSGCIPIMLKINVSDSVIYSCDISSNAITIAQKNAKNHNVNINFLQSNLFENINRKFDIIVSNPPYIPPQDKSTIQKEVTFEPEQALYTTDFLGIEFYEKIIKASRNYLTTNGHICFELGINQAELVKKLFMDYNFTEIEILKDLDNIDRVICARINNE